MHSSFPVKSRCVCLQLSCRMLDLHNDRVALCLHRAGFFYTLKSIWHLISLIIFLLNNLKSYIILIKYNGSAREEECMCFCWLIIIKQSAKIRVKFITVIFILFFRIQHMQNSVSAGVCGHISALKQQQLMCSLK